MRSLIVVLLFIFCSFSLHSNNFNEKKNSVYLQKINIHPQLLHRPKNAIEKHIILLKGIHLNTTVPKIVLKTRGESLYQSIIEPEAQINDDQAKIELAKILSRHEKSLNEAIQIYQGLLLKKPNDAEFLLAIGRIYNLKKKYCLALSYLYYAIDIHPNNFDLLVEAANSELSLSHVKKSHELLLRALAISKYPQSILMNEVNIFMKVGSFYKAEAIYDQALKDDPNSLELTLKLAWSLVSAERYEEAEGIYRKLLIHHPDDPKTLEALVTLKMIEKDFPAALNIAEKLLILFPEDPSYIKLKAQALYKNENYIKAFEEFDLLSLYPKFYLSALIGKGKVYEKLGCCVEAKEIFQKAYNYDPLSIQAQFYKAGCEVFEREFIQNIINHTTDPNDLLEWGSIYAEYGMVGIVELYEAALALDSNFFPAQIGLAEAFSSHYKYDEALKIYSSILDIFPEASKIMIAKARVLSWWKDYENSIQMYNQVITLNPKDPVPQREKARTANWGKFFNKSMQTYQKLLQPSVDQLLFAALQKIKISHECSLFSSMESLFKFVKNGSVYSGYETFSIQFQELADYLDLTEKLQIDLILADFLPLYRIQKSIQLESHAKYLDWNNFYLHALPVYQELVDFNPGNQEVIYSYAQDYCSLGLYKCSRRLYDYILNMNPSHDIVKMSLKRNLLNQHSLVQGNYNYWTERGVGQFSNSQIARHQLDEVFEWSTSCNKHFRFIESQWLEYPFFKNKYYPAEGQTIELDHVFNRFIKGALSATRKNYFNKFPSRYTCLGTLWFNLYDYANLAIGFERKNEIYNYFTLKQGIQSKVYWTSLTASSHSSNIATTYRHLDYNDHNTLDHLNLSAAYTFTEDPNTFKIIGDVSYRNTAHLTEIVTSPSTGQLLNIIHPYWTPQNYYSESITLEFRHNYAWFNFCEAPQRYLDIKLTGENDTSHNPSIQLVINWKHEFMYWGFEMQGMYHRSQLWNADGIWTKIYYRF